MIPERGSPARFGSTRKTTTPAPVPDDADVMESHGAVLVTVHDRDVAIARDPVAPSAEMLVNDGGLTDRV